MQCRARPRGGPFLLRRPMHGASLGIYLYSSGGNKSGHFHISPSYGTNNCPCITPIMKYMQLLFDFPLSPSCRESFLLHPTRPGGPPLSLFPPSFPLVVARDFGDCLLISLTAVASGDEPTNFAECVRCDARPLIGWLHAEPGRPSYTNQRLTAPSPTWALRSAFYPSELTLACVPVETGSAKMGRAYV